VIGDHGQHMIPLPQEVQVGSVNVSELLSKKEMDDEETKAKFATSVESIKEGISVLRKNDFFN